VAVRWGVLGTANIALERTIPAIGEVPSAECIALASRDLERARHAAEQLRIPKPYGRYEDVLNDPDVDAVYIPLPNDLHIEWADRTLRAGKAVLCEKPLGLRAAEVRTLIAVRDETAGLIEEALVFRNHPQWALLEQILSTGEIGRPLAVQGTIAKQFLDPKDIRNQPGLGGGASYDLAPYVIAACNLVFGRPPLRVSAEMDIDPNFGVDRLVTALLNYGDAHASFTASSQGGPAAWGTHQQFSILGSDGWLRATFPYAQARPVECTIEVGDATSVGAKPTSVHEFGTVNQYALQVERFSTLVAGGNARHWPIEDSLTTLTIIEALFQSARAHQSVELFL
jgi:predicted dehydrogenase